MGRISMPGETLVTETLEIEAHIVEALPTVETVRVKRDVLEKDALSRGCELSARCLRVVVIGITND